MVFKSWDPQRLMQVHYFKWLPFVVKVGSAGIILQAPALYDTRESIDIQLSEIEAATAKPLSEQAGKTRIFIWTPSTIRPTKQPTIFVDIRKAICKKKLETNTRTTH